MKVAVVRARFNEDFTSEMVEAAEEELSKRDVEYEIFEVPGVHEIPTVVSGVFEKDFDAAVALGAVIEGATDHDTVIAENVSKQLLELSCVAGKPVGLGVIGPGVSWSQVEKRTEQYAIEAVRAAVEVSETLDEI